MKHTAKQARIIQQALAACPEAPLPLNFPKSALVVDPGNGSRMVTEMTTITPRTAKALLERNTSNRPIRPTWVTDLAEAICRGEWETSHQGIALSLTGELLDGQHRLYACMLSGRAITVNVTYNAPRSSFLVLDGGVKRSAADQTGLSIRVVQILTMLSQVEGGTPNVRVTTAQIKALLARFGVPVSRVAAALPAGRRFKVTSIPVQTAAVVHLMNGNDDVLAQLNALSHGARVMVSQILRGKAGGTNRFDTMFRAWRAFEPGFDAKKIQIMDPSVPLLEMQTVVKTWEATR